LKIKPTFGQHSSQNIFLHLVHCHAVGFKNPPISLPHDEQNPLTMRITIEWYLMNLKNYALNSEEFYELLTSFRTFFAGDNGLVINECVNFNHEINCY